MLSATFFFMSFESIKGLQLINYISAKQHDISKAGSVHNISQISTAKKVKCQSRGKLNNFFFFKLEIKKQLGSKIQINHTLV